MKPSTTFVETKEAFHEAVRRLRCHMYIDTNSLERVNEKLNLDLQSSKHTQHFEMVFQVFPPAAGRMSRGCPRCPDVASPVGFQGEKSSSTTGIKTLKGHFVPVVHQYSSSLFYKYFVTAVHVAAQCTGFGTKKDEIPGIPGIPGIVETLTKFQGFQGFQELWRL